MSSSSGTEAQSSLTSIRDSTLPGSIPSTAESNSRKTILELQLLASSLYLVCGRWELAALHIPAYVNRVAFRYCITSARSLTAQSNCVSQGLVTTQVLLLLYNHIFRRDRKVSVAFHNQKGQAQVGNCLVGLQGY